MATSITNVKGIGPATAAKLQEQGIRSAEDLAVTTIDKLTGISGFSDTRAKQAIAAAKEATASMPATEVNGKKSAKVEKPKVKKVAKAQKGKTKVAKKKDGKKKVDSDKVEKKDDKKKVNKKKTDKKTDKKKNNKKKVSASKR